MRRGILYAFTGCLVVGAGLWFLASVFPYPSAPFGLHERLPLPVACAGRRCVTYRTWSSLATRLKTDEARNTDSADVLSRNSGEAVNLLTELLTSRAVGIVARRAGLGVSDEEVDQAITTVANVSADEKGLQKFLTGEYGGLGNSRFRSGMRDLLTRTKLAAVEIPDVWAHQSAPWVLILHFRYQWDPRAHRVVSR